MAEPGDLYCRKELALALHGVGRAAESIQAAREAVVFARAGGGTSSLGQAACAYHTLGVVLGEVGPEAVSVLTEGLLRYPENHSMRYSLANALIKANRCDEALSLNQALLAVPEGQRFDPHFSHDLRIFGEFAWGQRAAALWTLGRTTEAAEAFERAAALARSGADRIGYLSRAAVARGKQSELAAKDVGSRATP
jgi:tetratricopeptide (TPR) repeat protein